MKKWWISLALLAGFFALLASGLGRNPQELPSALLGKALPAMEVELPDAPYFLINIWGSWCPACHQEHAYLLHLAKKIPIIGINWAADNPQENQDGAEFLRRAGNPFSVVWYAGNGRIITDLGVYGAPETFLINRERHIIHRHTGVLDEAVWQRDFLPKMQVKP